MISGVQDVRGPVQPAANVKRIRRLSTDERIDLVEQYVAGQTVYQLASKYGIHRHTVSKHLRAAEVRLRLDGLTNEQELEAAHLYESGLSLAKIGDRFGVAARTVLTSLRKQGITMRDSNGRERLDNAV